MTDKEKVVKGLKQISDFFSDAYRKETNIFDYTETKNKCDTVENAIALLKEQETEWEHLWDAPDKTFKGRCKKCGFVHLFIEGHDAQYKFCPECGRLAKLK